MLLHILGDYRELEGEYIPYSKLGFRSLEDLFEKVPGFRLIKQNNKFFVDASAPREVEHITEMIAKQKSAPRKYSKKFVQRPVSICLDFKLNCSDLYFVFNKN